MTLIPANPLAPDGSAATYIVWGLVDIDTGKTVEQPCVEKLDVTTWGIISKVNLLAAYNCEAVIVCLKPGTLLRIVCFIRLASILKPSGEDASLSNDTMHSNTKVLQVQPMYRVNVKAGVSALHCGVVTV